VPCSDDDEIRRSCLAGDKFIRQFKSGAPFNLLEMLAFAAESPAHLIEACAHRPAILFGGLVIDDDAPGGESGPQWQACDANESRLKSVG
jgi:hypothetical protein